MNSSGERLTTYEQVSAGGAAYRRSDDGQIEIAVILTASEGRWQLPKGMIDPGESEIQAAQREVREEAGIETELIGKIDTTEYWFTAERDGIRRRIHKSVHWYLMRFTGGSVNDHDDEVTECRWVNSSDAVDLLEFKNEREIVEKAVTMIRNRAGASG